MANVDC